MARNGFAHDFAPELHQLFPSPSTETVTQPHADLGQYLRLVASQERLAVWQTQLSSGQVQPVVIDQAPADLPAAWKMAASNAAYAAVLLWRAVRLTAIAAQGRYHALLNGTLDPKTRDFLTGASVPGWACTLILTALFIWR